MFRFLGGIIWQKIGYFPVSKNVEYKFTLPEKAKRIISFIRSIFGKKKIEQQNI